MRNQTNPLRAHQLLLGLMVLLVGGLTTSGCGEKANTPPSQGTVENQIKSNPKLSPEAQQASLDKMHARQRAGQIRGQAMQRSLNDGH